MNTQEVTHLASIHILLVRESHHSIYIQRGLEYLISGQPLHSNISVSWKEKQNFAEQLFLSYSASLATCSKTSATGDYLNPPWSLRPSQSPGCKGDAKSSPLNLDMAPHCPETFILKDRLLPSHDIMMDQVQNNCIQKFPFGKGKNGRCSHWAMTWKKSCQTLPKTSCPGSRGSSLFFRLCVFYLGITLFIVICSPGHPLRGSSLPIAHTSKMDIGKYVLLGNYITFSAPFLLVQVWVPQRMFYSHCLFVFFFPQARLLISLTIQFP